jgi:hypothetical protein
VIGAAERGHASARGGGVPPGTAGVPARPSRCDRLPDRQPTPWPYAISVGWVCRVHRRSPHHLRPGRRVVALGEVDGMTHPSPLTQPRGPRAQPSRRPAARRGHLFVTRELHILSTDPTVPASPEPADHLATVAMVASAGANHSGPGAPPDAPLAGLTTILEPTIRQSPPRGPNDRLATALSAQWSA